MLALRPENACQPFTAITEIGKQGKLSITVGVVLAALLRSNEYGHTLCLKHVKHGTGWLHE